MRAPLFVQMSWGCGHDIQITYHMGRVTPNRLFCSGGGGMVIQFGEGYERVTHDCDPVGSWVFWLAYGHGD